MSAAAESRSAADAAQVEAERLRHEWLGALAQLRLVNARGTGTAAHPAAYEAATMALAAWVNADADAKTAAEKARVEWAKSHYGPVTPP